MKFQTGSTRLTVSLFVSLCVVLLFTGASIAVASLTFTGTSISGDSGVLIDSSSTISIGTSTATGITIGRSGQTTTFPGNVSIVGSLLGYLTTGNNLSDLTSTSTARVNIGLSNLANALQLIAANNLSDLTSTSSARANIGFSAGNKISISPTGIIGLTTTSISQFFNDAGYVTSTSGGIPAGSVPSCNTTTVVRSAVTQTLPGRPLRRSSPSDRVQGLSYSEHLRFRQTRSLLLRPRRISSRYSIMVTSALGRCRHHPHFM